MPLSIPDHLLSAEGLVGTPSDPGSLRKSHGASRCPLWPEPKEALWEAVESSVSGLKAK